MKIAMAEIPFLRILQITRSNRVSKSHHTIKSCEALPQIRPSDTKTRLSRVYLKHYTIKSSIAALLTIST